MTLNELKTRRIESGITYEELGRLSGVPVTTIQKIFSGKTRSPRYKTVAALENVLKQKDPRNGNAGHHDELVAESMPAYRTDGTSAINGDFEENGLPGQHYNSLTEINYRSYRRQGSYTLKDYFALPDDQRVELIDGVFYDMSAPLITHQLIVSQLTYCFNRYIDENNGSCEVFNSPTDVQLDRDDKTVVEPDVLVVCSEDCIYKERIYGAPDLVIEVLSGSTRKKDQTLKLWKYANAGVREYWIVDPQKIRIHVWQFEKDEDQIYSFHDKVPVGIYDGNMVVNFERIWKKIARFYSYDGKLASDKEGSADEKPMAAVPAEKPAKPRNAVPADKSDDL